MRKWQVFVLGLLLAVGAVSAPAAAADADQRYYVIAHSGPGDPFWAVVQRGVQDAGRALGVNAIFQGPIQGGDVPAQVNMFNSAVSARADGIATTISDPNALARPIERARNEGIPVVAINVKEPAEFSRDIPYMSYIGMDEYEAGRVLADFMLPNVPEGAHVVVANHDPGHVGLENRSRGITDLLTEAVGAEVDKLDVTTDPSKAILVIRGYLSANPDTRAIFALGPLSTIPTLEVLEEEGLAGEIKVAAFDLDPVTVNGIKRGHVEATVDQQPYLQGYMAVVQLYLAHNYDFMPADYETGRGLVTADNAALIEDLVEQGYR